MAASNINRVIITGNLTADPELRSLPSGTSVCKLRVACNTRRKDGASGEWVDKPNYFDVTVWGAQGENCARYLAKGRGVAVDGRLEWREWESDAGKRSAVDIIADSVQFLGGGQGEGGRRPAVAQLHPAVRRPGRHERLRHGTGRRLGTVRGRHPVLGNSRRRPWQAGPADGGACRVLGPGIGPEPLTDRGKPVPSTLCASRAIRRAFLTP